MNSFFLPVCIDQTISPCCFLLRLPMQFSPSPVSWLSCPTIAFHWKLFSFALCATMLLLFRCFLLLAQFILAAIFSSFCLQLAPCSLVHLSYVSYTWLYLDVILGCFTKLL